MREWNSLIKKNYNHHTVVEWGGGAEWEFSLQFNK